MKNRRNTPSKALILELLREQGVALSQDKVEGALKGTMDRVTVYRVLNRFCEDGIVHRVMADNGKYYYALCSGCGNGHSHDHFHFRCMACDRVECLERQVQVSLPSGYQAENFGGWVSGRCRQCAEGNDICIEADNRT